MFSPSVFCFTLGKVSVTSIFAGLITLFCRVRLLYFAECDLAHGKALPSDREKALGKAGFAVTTVAVWSLPSMPHSANPLPSALCALPCVSDTRQRARVQ